MRKSKRGAEEVLSEDDFALRRKQGCLLRIHSGFDPTATGIHHGHTVLLDEMQQNSGRVPQVVITMSLLEGIDGVR